MHACMHTYIHTYIHTYKLNTQINSIVLKIRSQTNYLFNVMHLHASAQTRKQPDNDIGLQFPWAQEGDPSTDEDVPGHRQLCSKYCANCANVVTGLRLCFWHLQLKCRALTMNMVSVLKGSIPSQTTNICEGEDTLQNHLYELATLTVLDTCVNLILCWWWIKSGYNQRMWRVLMSATQSNKYLEPKAHLKG